MHFCRFAEGPVALLPISPHFHALYAEYEALIDLRNISVIRGSLPGRAMALVLEWADDHRDELLSMPPNANAQTYRTPEVEPTIKHTVPWRLTSLAALPDARLHVVLVDGTNGEVHLKSFLNSPTINGTVFEALRDPAIFAQAQIILGAVQWPNGADLAPDTMYDAIREHRVWVLE